MSQSLAMVRLHIVFSTRYREPFLHDPDVRHRVHVYIARICNDNDSYAHIVGGVADHVHILCNLSRKRTIADLTGDIKRRSSRWINQEIDGLSNFSWQSGYSVFSVNPLDVNLVSRYISNQEAHHAKQTFQDEFRGYMQRYSIEFDERYVWD